MTKLDYNNNYGDKYVCDLKSSDIVEATYTYTYKDGKFSKKQTSKVTAKKFIQDNEITCS